MKSPQENKQSLGDGGWRCFIVMSSDSVGSDANDLLRSSAIMCEGRRVPSHMGRQHMSHTLTISPIGHEITAVQLQLILDAVNVFLLYTALYTGCASKEGWFINSLIPWPEPRFAFEPAPCSQCKTWLLSSKYSATPVYRLSGVLQFSATHFNGAELQYQTPTMKRYGAIFFQ